MFIHFYNSSAFNYVATSLSANQLIWVVFFFFFFFALLQKQDVVFSCKVQSVGVPLILIIVLIVSRQ